MHFWLKAKASAILIKCWPKNVRHISGILCRGGGGGGTGLYRPSWQHTNMYQPMAMYELLEEIEMSFDKSECTRYCRMRSAYIVWIQGEDSRGWAMGQAKCQTNASQTNCRAGQQRKPNIKPFPFPFRFPYTFNLRND